MNSDNPVAATTPSSNPPTVLCVDDEPNILSALRRLFGLAGLSVVTAESGEQALEILENQGFDVLVSDIKMPGMDGITLIAKARIRWPEMIRILLTGNADLAGAVEAVNKGEVFKFHLKPWQDDELFSTVQSGLQLASLRRDRARLLALTESQNKALDEMVKGLEKRVEERTAELVASNSKLHKSYYSVLQAVSNLISLRQPQLLDHARRVAELSRRTAIAIGLPEAQAQDIFVGGLLHDLGKLGMSDQLLRLKVHSFTAPESQEYQKHPARGEAALHAIDDLRAAREIIRSHHERYNGSGFPDRIAGESIPVGARIVSIAEAYEELLSGDLTPQRPAPLDAQNLILRNAGTLFDPRIAKAFVELLRASKG